MRNPGVVVKCGWNGKVPSNVSSAAMPPTRTTLLIRVDGAQDLLEAQSEEELNCHVTIIDVRRQQASKNRKPVLHRVDVNAKVSGDQLEVAALHQVALQGGEGPRFLEARRTFREHAVRPSPCGNGFSKGDAVLA